MKATLTKDIGLAILRIGTSLMMLTHGFGKFQNLVSGNLEFGNPLGLGEAPTLFLAVLAEFLCPILIILGFKTRWAAIPTIITMFVAAFLVHDSDPIGTKEKALLFLISFSTIALLGPGRFSIDRK